MIYSWIISTPSPGRDSSQSSAKVNFYWACLIQTLHFWCMLSIWDSVFSTRFILFFPFVRLYIFSPRALPGNNSSRLMDFNCYLIIWWNWGEFLTNHSMYNIRCSRAQELKWENKQEWKKVIIFRSMSERELCHRNAPFFFVGSIKSRLWHNAELWLLLSLSSVSWLHKMKKSAIEHCTLASTIWTLTTANCFRVIHRMNIRAFGCNSSLIRSYSVRFLISDFGLLYMDDDGEWKWVIMTHSSYKRPLFSYGSFIYMLCWQHISIWHLCLCSFTLKFTYKMPGPAERMQ